MALDAEPPDTHVLPSWRTVHLRYLTAARRLGLEWVARDSDKGTESGARQMRTESRRRARLRNSPRRARKASQESKGSGGRRPSGRVEHLGERVPSLR